MADNSQDIERSRQAQEILNHDIFKDALVMLREHYKELWATTKAEEEDQRERIWMA